MDVGSILKALFYVAIGLLLIDLAPIHEGMTCENPSNATTCPDVYFSQSFFVARQRFVSAAAAVGAKLARHVVHTDAETGLEYPMDTAFVEGAGDAAKDLIVHVSGVHGAEGFIGSAIQTKLLSTSEFWSAASRPSVLFVHAVNPYGFAELRRFNENNVDLNRNCLLTPAEWAEVLERDPNIVGYETFDPVLNPKHAPSALSRYTLLLQAAYYIARVGLGKLKATFVTGQYHNPKGVYFGGRELQPSLKILVNEIRRFAAGRRRVVCIDVHSGLGEPGVDTYHLHDADDAKASQVVWPTRELLLPGVGTSSGYELTRGNLDYRKIVTGASSVVQILQEFGTVPSVFVARACILENQAYWHARNTYVHTVTKNWLRDAFYPQELAVKALMLKGGESLFSDAFAHLVGSSR